MWFKNTASITEQMRFNLNHRAYNIAKYYDWLEVNLMTPIYIKLRVLDSCMFLAYLYGSECWSTIDEVGENILALERKCLKSILQVKPSTPNALIYIELGRPDMISIVKVRQKNFYERCKKLTKEQAIMRCILEMCQNLNLDITRYYKALDDGLAA